MYKPEKEITDIQYFIKKKSWTLVAWWKGNLGKELHWDYEYVWSIEQGKEVLRKYWWKDTDLYYLRIKDDQL